MQNYNPHHCNPQHTNAFVDLNGFPYLLAEYLDRRNFQQIDRSMIRSEIHIDQTESMRAIVDISIDDIGKRASDGLPDVIGNTSKFTRLLEMIKTNSDRSDHQLNVVKRSIVIRVNYQLENQRTGQVIRSMCEDLRIDDRSYFLDINPRNIDDNAIIVNFSNSMVSSINEFTHGTDRMLLRITTVQMYYECLQKDPRVPRLQQMVSPQYAGERLPTMYGTEQEMHEYHQQMQHRHVFGYGGDDGYNSHCYDNTSMISPPSWTGFNRYYHFDEDGHMIILHDQEIRYPGVKVLLIAAGVVAVNRAFTINPGHRIVFKFCIWKNDLTVVNDTLPIAEALEAYIGNGCHHDHYHEEDHCHHPINPDYETMIRLYRELQCMNDRQNGVINQIMLKLDNLTDQVNALLPPVVEPEPPVDPPVEPDEPTDPPTDPPVEPETPNPDEENPSQ